MHLASDNMGGVQEAPLLFLGKRVLIATPALTGQVDMRYAYALAETIRMGERLGVRVNVMFRGLDAMLQRVRNDLVKDALDHEYTDLVFIDADQDWKPEDFFRLLSYQVDCVGAPVQKKTDDHERYNVHASGPNLPRDLATGLLMVDAVGTGFLRLSRYALKALWDRSEPYVDDAGNHNRWMFDLGPMAGRLVGEDTTVCNKLRDAGIKVYIDPNVTVGHTGTKRWAGDFRGWLTRLQSEARGEA